MGKEAIVRTDNEGAFFRRGVLIERAGCGDV
jgi:hypothetical protein